MSTGLPIDISSSMRGQNYISFCRMDIDIHRNIPHIHLHVKHGNKDKWHGAEIQVVIEGNWTTYRVCPGGQISTWIPDAAANAVNKRNNPSAGGLRDGIRVCNANRSQRGTERKYIFTVTRW
ncbi:hypothetical protein V6N13_066394 [Hibiscus sabdariffa]